jgi:acyl-coenzyme A synthetase/AMP-(fatty) acid ligase
MFRPILQAIPMVIVPDTAIYDPGQLCQFLAQNRITRMLFTPSLLEMLLDTQEEAALAQAFKHMRCLPINKIKNIFDVKINFLRP